MIAILTGDSAVTSQMSHEHDAPVWARECSVKLNTRVAGA